MNVFDALLQRRSVSPKQLTDPGPSEAHLELMLQAGARAADHGRLLPWRFILVRGAARVKLGEVFATARRQREPKVNEAELARERAKPLRAPLVLMLGVKVVHDHATVRAVDQVLAGAAAAQNVLLAAFALGYGAMWLTGSNSHDPNVKRALGLDATDEIIGSLYIGTSVAMPEPKPVEDMALMRREWT